LKHLWKTKSYDPQTKAFTNNIQGNHPQNLNKCFDNSKQETFCPNYGESNY
jgi:hypothetical protein